MIDLGVSKLALIAVVALVVVGPERLPKVARMAGNLFGRAQRYMADVKSEVNRQMEMEEFKKFREESASALKEVENSVLWILVVDQICRDNLKKFAHNEGIDSKKLIFTNQLPIEEHLKRLPLADIHLDTFPYNAHTTASDALWAGLPVLTLMGQSFASRVAASLLNAIGLPELITHRQEEYESLAIGLANNPERLKALKEKLAHQRLTTPLFDTPQFTKDLEQAYLQMVQRYQADLPPEHLFVE